MKSIEQKVIKFISSHSLLSANDKILVALSGGPDSVFLLHFLKKYQKKFKIELAAFHLNHLIRKSADEEQGFCAKLCKKLSVPFHTEEFDVKSFAVKNKISVEEAGRLIRYVQLNKYAHKFNFNLIATAHNADDNAETVLLNLSKGTGIKGIAGIPVKRENIIRPLLCLRKNEILDYLKKNNIKFVIDESNLSEQYERNFLRMKIIPIIENKINPQFVNSVLTTSINLQSFNTYLNKILSEIEKKYVVETNEEVRIKINLFTEQENFIQTEIIRKALTEKFDFNPSQKDIRKIISLFDKQVGSIETFKQKLKALRERNSITIFSNKSLPEKSILIKVGESKRFDSGRMIISKVNSLDVKLTANKNVEFVDGELTGESFLIRKWKDGDKFHPFGMKGTKKLSDYLNDIKVETKEKRNQYVLISKNRIVWIVGKRLDERFKLRPETKTIYKLKLINE
ncbi:tRNA lysidine(34) synthetase TilS [Ignavibacterium sp.]|uniref:tRNA lysidine(34) synthetase TilS n=1 Tax=Ignavibacterium sp. TaxID=2651167 RepID=UPI00307E0230